MKLFIYLGIILSVVFISCNENHTYSFEKKIENNLWSYDDEVKFYPQIDDASLLYDLSLQIKHGEFYSFENIYIRISDDFTGVLNVDTISFNLSNRNGFWIGTENNDYYDATFLLRKGFKFPKKGKYNFKIEQFTREDSLTEINSIKMFIDKSIENK